MKIARIGPNNLFFISLALVFFPALKADYTPVTSIYFPTATFLTTDKLGNAYVLIENQMLKFDTDGKPLASYSQKNLGTIRYVDASDPMKVLCFYPDFARLVVLDSKLSVQSEIDLRAIEIFQPISICNSHENGYWVYDREDDELKKIDYNLQVVQKSGKITQETGVQVQPGLMAEEGGFIYLNNPATGILMFDRTGSFYKTIAYRDLKSFQVIGRDVLFINNNKLFRFDAKSFSDKEVLLPQHDSLRSVRIENEKLYLLTTDSLKFYYF